MALHGEQGGEKTHATINVLKNTMGPEKQRPATSPDDRAHGAGVSPVSRTATKNRKKVKGNRVSVHRLLVVNLGRNARQ